MLNANTILVAAPDQVSCDIGNQMAILNLKNGIYYGLDTVGSRVWELIQTPRRYSDVAAVLLEEYEVGPERLDSDLQGLCRGLVKAGLIEIQDEIHG